MPTRSIKIKSVLLDMDGVLWRGPEPLLDIGKLLEGFRCLGCRVYCVTNNSTNTVQRYQEKLSGLGAELDASQIVTSAEATAVYLASRFASGSRVFVLGEEGLKKTIQNAGFQVIASAQEQNALAAVVGLDRNFVYQDLNLAVQHICRGAEFIGTNPDRTIPTPDGPAPGAGAIIEAIEASCGSKAIMIGKPAQHLFKVALSRSGVAPEETLMIGDRLETDILGAQKLAIKTGLVLSGITTRADAENWHPRPDIIAENAVEILRILEKAHGKLI
jgi:4-nitrophenyl phosphatase